MTPMCPEHVLRWLSQFTPEFQLSFLREFNHVIKETFITEAHIRDFLTGIIKNKNITNGLQPSQFWKTANILNIQKNGFSQKDMLNTFEALMRESEELELNQCGGVTGEFFYLDDAMFSGLRMHSDLKEWFTISAPKNAVVNIIVAVDHQGTYWHKSELIKLASELGKNITFKFWNLFKIEDRKMYRDQSEVLWPSIIPDDDSVRSYLDKGNDYPLELRSPISPTPGLFSSEAGRQVLESEFFKAGARIISRCNEPNANMRPLGFSKFGVGFGSMIVTYRNCPNNCPLALWWGDATVQSGGLNWYPLLPREGYSSPRNVFGF